MAAAVALYGADPDEVKIAEYGADEARGLLVNRTIGARPFDPPDISRPTVVVVHGLNPFHPVLHFAMDVRYGESIGARYGNSVNVLGWDWNAATGLGVTSKCTDKRSVAQGMMLADAVDAAGLDLSKLQLIGQSSGCIVVAAAARRLADRRGVPVQQVTLIDPVIREHPLIFQTFEVGSSAVLVEHFWVDSPSGFGRPAPYPNIRNISVPGVRRWHGLYRPLHTDHLNTVRWHITQMGM